MRLFAIFGLLFLLLNSCQAVQKGTAGSSSDSNQIEMTNMEIKEAVLDFRTSKDHVAVDFQISPATYKLMKSNEDFAESMKWLAHSWKTQNQVAVTINSMTLEILKVRE